MYIEILAILITLSVGPLNWLLILKREVHNHIRGCSFNWIRYSSDRMETSITNILILRRYAVMYNSVARFLKTKCRTEKNHCVT